MHMEVLELRSMIGLNQVRGKICIASKEWKLHDHYLPCFLPKGKVGTKVKDLRFTL